MPNDAYPHDYTWGVISGAEAPTMAQGDEVPPPKEDTKYKGMVGQR